MKPVGGGGGGGCGGCGAELGGCALRQRAGCCRGGVLVIYGVCEM
jgi:hypothetical protein